jgi:hypothetical protein
MRFARQMKKAEGKVIIGFTRIGSKVERAAMAGEKKLHQVAMQPCQTVGRGRAIDPVIVFSFFLSSASSVFFPQNVRADLEAPPRPERDPGGQKEDWSYLWVRARRGRVVGRLWVERGQAWDNAGGGLAEGVLLVNG